jgi:hypothetical protein
MWCRGKVFVPSREEVTGYWRKMNNEEPRDFYFASDNIRFIKTKEKEMGRSCGVNGGRRNSYRVLVMNPEGKRLGG